MSRKIQQIWAKKGGVQISDVGWGFFVVKFDTIEDFDHAMFGGPWMVGDHYVVIQNWRPYFRPEDASLTTLRVWVRLPGLPLEYFDYGILKRIGDRIGTTVRMDQTTLEGARGNFARICVEVDLSKPLLSKYRLRRRVRRIEYEGLHTICFGCGCYGHEESSCTVAKGEDVLPVATTTFSNPVFGGADPHEQRPEVEEDFGPWMKVKRQARRTGPAKSPLSTPATVVGQSKPNEKGKASNSFTILEDLEDGADLGCPIKERSDTLERLESMEGNKENEGVFNGDPSQIPSLKADPPLEKLPPKSDVAADSTRGGAKGGKAQTLNGAKSIRVDSAKGQIRLGQVNNKPKDSSKPGNKKSSSKLSKQEGESPKLQGLSDSKQLKAKSLGVGSEGSGDFNAQLKSPGPLVEPEIVLVEDITMGEALAD
ncbi:hypothetical protein LINPERHAP2_LOCUS16637 [Linum perenne]